jgi:D-alanine--poly(phosphoribitol) ligase subunit 2
LITQPTIASHIETFVRTQFEVDPGDDGFDRTIDLFELGYVDSVGFAELLAFIAEEFGVEVPEADLLSEDFLSIDGMARIVSRLTATAEARSARQGAPQRLERSLACRPRGRRLTILAQLERHLQIGHASLVVAGLAEHGEP